MKSEDAFWAMAERMLLMARHHGFDVYGEAPLGWRFEVPLSFWEAARVVVASEYGWEVPPDAPPPGYRMLGYPFVVDPNLPDDGLRLVRP